MPRMRSLQLHPWGDSHKSIGDEFDASDNEATLIEALGWAERIGEAPRARTLSLRNRNMQPRPPAGYETK
jgi:hypothetical protein